LTVRLARKAHDTQGHRELHLKRSRRAFHDDANRVVPIVEDQPNPWIDKTEVSDQTLETLSDRVRTDDQIVQERSGADRRVSRQLQRKVRDPFLLIGAGEHRGARARREIRVRILDVRPL
jgi:hypothetical protein